MPLDQEAAERAVTEKVAAPLGYDAVRAADAIIQVANANMADAVRLISIRRGYDPRDFCLVAFGGAGSVHAAHPGRELDIPAVVVPPILASPQRSAASSSTCDTTSSVPT